MAEHVDGWAQSMASTWAKADSQSARALEQFQKAGRSDDERSVLLRAGSRRCSRLARPARAPLGDATSLRDAQNTDGYLPGSDHTLAHVSVGAAIGLGAVLGLALGIVVSLTTDVPFAPEAGLVLGALLGWLSRRRLVS
jgi:hypothetical protein